MFSFIKEKLQKIYSHLTAKLGAFFNRTLIDTAALKELEILLLSSDVGVKTTRYLIETIKKSGVSDGTGLYHVLHKQLITTLQIPTQTIDPEKGSVFIIVGINGSGKTTSIAKLAHRFKKEGERVLIVAADTFRAAAVDQLGQWAEKIGIDMYQGTPDQDPSAVVFAGAQQFIEGNYTKLIIDTAGRLQTKVNLMHELAKMKRVLQKQLAHKEPVTLLTIDGMLGQNSFEQARLFKESTQVDGIILTKMDGTGKGGIVFAIAQELEIPVSYLTYGEAVDAITAFNPQTYVDDLLSKVE